MKLRTDSPIVVVAAIIGGALLVAAAIAYLGQGLAARPDEARVIALIEERLGQQTPGEQTSKGGAARALSEKDVAALIDKRLTQQKGGQPDADFNARVEQSIVAFLEKQRRAEQERPRQLAKNAPRPTKGDHLYGNPNAPVTLIEYSDFECPFCKRFHLTAKQLVSESNGQVNWVYRHFPLDQLHPGKARREAVASECANELGGNEAFWKFADRFFELTPSNNRTDVDTVLPQIARDIGLDEKAFSVCLKSGKHDKRIEDDVKSAIASGGNGTPWSIVMSKNGKTYPLSGAQPLTAIKQLVELALKEK